jgi:hypothetical protein
MRKAFDTALTRLKPPTPLLAKDGALHRIPRSTAFIALQKALELFQEVAGTTGVPGLQEGVKCLKILLDAIQVHLSRHSFPLSRSQMDPTIVENVPEQRGHRIVSQAYPGLTRDAAEGIKWRPAFPSYD